MPNTFEGYLLIADITGYTWFLSESELDHAQDTLTELLRLLVDHTRPPLVISRLAGDAVISYGLRDHFFHDQTLIEKIEETYVAFRRMIELMVLNNTCQCNACANVSKLDLKFFFHYGTFGIQRIADHDELIGADVNLLHRLLKNHVTDATGFRAYSLYTDAAVAQLGLGDLAASFAPHFESYEHLGEVKVWVQDMHPIWQEKRQTSAISIPEERVLRQHTITIAMPRESVWDHLARPEFRNTLIGSDRMEVANRKGGRVAPGSVYQCYHGDRLVPQTILEWRPFERIITQDVFPMSVANTFLTEYRLDSTDEGTRLTLTGSKPSGPALGRALFRVLSPVFSKVMNKNMASFKHHIEEDYRAQAGKLQSGSEITEALVRDAAAASLHPGSPPRASG
jgi:uncharacterized protein YndB with AHSA1/START domain